MRCVRGRCASWTSAARLVELQVRRSKRVRGHRMVVRHGLPPELVVRPRATAAQIDEAIDFHRSWLERQLAKVARAAARPRPPAAHRGAGTPRGARAHLAARAVGGRRARRRRTRASRMRDQRSRWGSCSSERARSASTGGSCSRRTTCSTTSSCTRCATWSSTTTARRSGGSSRSAAPTYRGVEGVARRPRLGDPRVPAAGRGRSKPARRRLVDASDDVERSCERVGGQLRLLRDADRLGRRCSRRARARVRRRARRRAARAATTRSSPSSSATASSATAQVLTESMRRLGAPAGRGARPRRVAARLARVPRGSRARSRSCAAAAGGSRSSPTPTTTSSPRRRCRSASSFDEVVVAQEIGSYKPAHRHWEEFFAARTRRATGTCTSPHRCSTTSRRRTSSA